MSDLLPLMIGAAAVLHCLFLIVVLLRLSSKLTNQLLVGVLFMLAARMGACLIGLIYPELELAGIYVGAVAFASTGPLVHFYLIGLWNPSLKLKGRELYHFIPAVLILLSFPFISVYVAFGTYLFSLLMMTIYIIAGAIRLKKNNHQNCTDQIRWKWTNYFVAGMAVLLLLFHSQSFFFDALVYQWIIIGAALVLYALTLLALKQVKLFMAVPKKKDKKQQLEELGTQLEVLLHKEEVFTNPLMTVSLLAAELKAPSYRVSQAINAHFNQSFPEVINSLRIQKAEQLLMDASKSHYTVEAIAYESGFSTLSAFYGTFKKVHRKTPTEFRNKSQ